MGLFQPSFETTLRGDGFAAWPRTVYLISLVEDIGPCGVGAQLDGRGHGGCVTGSSAVGGGAGVYDVCGVCACGIVFGAGGYGEKG